MVLVGGMQAHRELKEAHGFDVGEVNVTIHSYLTNPTHHIDFYFVQMPIEGQLSLYGMKSRLRKTLAINHV